MRVLGSLFLLAGMGINALATAAPVVPEVDTRLATSGLAILCGAFLILRARRKK